MNVTTTSVEKTFGSILDRVTDSFNSFKGTLQHLINQAKTRQNTEVPNYVNVAKLTPDKTVLGESRVFPQSLEYMFDLDIVLSGDSEGYITLWNAEDLNKICSI